MKPLSARKPLSAPVPQRREAMTGARRHSRHTWKTTCSGGHDDSPVGRQTSPIQTPKRPESVRPRGPRKNGPRAPTGPAGLAYASRRGAIIGMRSHYRRTRYMTPSPHRRVKPLSAHVRDYTSPHWRTPQILRGHCRHAQFMSELATHRAMPSLARQAIIGSRDTIRAPSSTREAIIGSRPNTRSLYRRGSHYRRLYSSNA